MRTGRASAARAPALPGDAFLEVHMIHHVQLACPPGSEAALRAFYDGVLGLDEFLAYRPARPRTGGYWRSSGSGISTPSSQPTTPTMIAPQNAAQNPVMWNGSVSLPATQLVSQSSRPLTTSPIRPSVST